jgi:ribonuclease BN (tRNA processing enzyme)
MGRRSPLEVFGPYGIKAVTDHVLKAWQVDIDGRTSGLNQHNLTGYKVEAREVAPGVVHRDSDLTVTAFPVRHEEMVDSFGYRFDTPDRTIVIFGDTAPTQALIHHSRDCDVLIHEAYSTMAARNVARPSAEFRRRHHTSSAELADIANQIKPQLLITYHRSNVGEEDISAGRDVLIEEIKSPFIKVASWPPTIWPFFDRRVVYCARSALGQKAMSMPERRCPLSAHNWTCRRHSAV